MKKVIVFFIVMAILPLVIADVYVGTSEGYIFDTDGGLVSGATVRATVNSCVVQCSQEKLSESTGYYVIANLNLPKNELLTVYAEKNTPLGLEFGFGIDSSNEFQAAFINVTICLPPTLPVLTPEPNTHDTSATLEWISSNDKKGYSTYDEYRFDSGSIIKINNAGKRSQDESGLSFSSHLWQVRTCNPFCCSFWAKDSFNVGNVAPSSPNLTDQLDTAPGKLTFNWVSGVDPDGDATFDEYEFGVINSNDKTSLTAASSPQSEEVFSSNYYLWRGRTCEVESENLCSEWSEDGFVVCGVQCPQCSSISSTISDFHEEGGFRTQSLTIIAQPDVEEGFDYILEIAYTSVNDNQHLIFKINSSDFNFNDFVISNLYYKTARFQMIGKPKAETKEGIYNITLNVFNARRHVFSETISVTVKGSLYIKIIRTLGERKFPILLVSVLVLMLIAAIYFYIWKKSTMGGSKSKSNFFKTK